MIRPSCRKALLFSSILLWCRDIRYLLGQLVNGFLILGKDLCGDLVTELGVDRMNDILILSLGGTAAGHSDEESVITFNDLNVVNNKLMIESNGNNGLHFAL